MRHVITGVLLALAFAASAVAADKTITLPPDHSYATLKAGPGVEVVQRQCGLCHSTDYIVQQPRGSAQQWGSLVTKMIKVYGAPLSDEDTKTIVDYLAKQYGN